ncbi:topoisomerase DNA-binding C4 zinc finger domain-containing protein [Patescibacteria group bacterium]|nr:topoisomerase DNA-binding C4 zinc finger domain-containing protein [Patescibacteria group bacterium]
MVDKKIDESNETCPKCGSVLGDEYETKTGRKLRRCSVGRWDPETKKVKGCDYVKWLPVEPKVLEENCPKCGAPLIMTVTRFGKKMKKCSTATWDSKTKTAGGCDFIEWIKGMSETLEEDCPKCGSKLILYTSPNGKKLKKCSTNQWDPKEKIAVGCDFVEWQKS